MTTKLTYRWQTICTTGYTCSVSRDENRAAHGAVCHRQACRNRDGYMVGRLVNSNGRHRETGEAFPLSADQLAQWEQIERSAK
jgi:hypothetical protein